MKVEAVRKLLSLGEGQSVEFKSDCQEIGVIGPTVCGFLNTSGGYIVCGVDERGELTGIDSAAGLAKDLEVRLQRSLSPGALVSVQVHEVEGRTLLVVEVPAGKDLPYAFENVIYIRTGEANTRTGQTTQKADVETIRDMVLRKQVEPERWERRFSSADMNADLNFNEVRSTVKAVVESGRFPFRDGDNPIMILEDLSVSKYGRLTNGGDVLFGANPTIRYPQTRVRAAVFRTDRAGDTYHDMKSYEGPLVPVLEDVYAFILRNTPTTSRFRTTDLKRQDEPLYPSNAIREGLVNAFAHRDYSDFSGGIIIHIYPDRLEIWNSGRFPEGVIPSRFKAGTLSVLRNPDIAHVIYLRGYMEKVGRGIALIQKACAERGLPPPQWSEDDRGVTLTFFAPEVTPEVTPEVLRMFSVLEGDLSRQDLQNLLDLKDREHFRQAYLQPALRECLVEMTLSDRPRSSKQRYRLTGKGRSVRGGGRS